MDYRPFLKHTKVVDDSIDKIIDQTDPNVIYMGWAIIGSATGDSKWKIKRIKSSGSVIYMGYADSNENYDNEWDERVNLTYSQGGA